MRTAGRKVWFYPRGSSLSPPIRNQPLNPVRKTIFCALLCACLGDALAQSDLFTVLSVTPARPSSNDQIVAVLSSPLGGCTPTVDAVVTRVNQQVTVNQPYPTAPFNGSGTPCTERVTIGRLQPGAYDLDWVKSASNIRMQLYRTSFFVSVEPQSVPINSTTAIVISSILIASMTGVVAFGRAPSLSKPKSTKKL